MASQLLTETLLLAFAGVSGIVLAIGALAALVPAVRASRIEPMRVLREE